MTPDFYSKIFHQYIYQTIIGYINRVINIIHTRNGSCITGDRIHDLRYIIGMISNGVLKWITELHSEESNVNENKNPLHFPYEIRRGFELIIPYIEYSSNESLGLPLDQGMRYKWLITPLCEWPINELDREKFNYNNYVVLEELEKSLYDEEVDEITDECIELALLHDEKTEFNKIHKAFYEKIQEISYDLTTENCEHDCWYTKIRAFIVNNPYVIGSRVNKEFSHIFEILKDEGFYQEGNLQYAKKSKVKICRYCNFPIRRNEERHGFPCSESTKKPKEIELGNRIFQNKYSNPQETLYVLNEIVWKTISLPGIPEMELYNELVQSDEYEKVTLYPYGDKADILIIGKDGYKIGIDVKATRLKTFIYPSLVKDLVESDEIKYWNELIYAISDVYYDESYADVIKNEVQQTIEKMDINPIKWDVMNISKTISYIEEVFR